VVGADRREKLIAFALSLPEAYEDHPWGETVAKVGKKVFCFFGTGGPSPNISLKLPDSAEEALSFEKAAPTGYGLGRAGWVTIPVASVPAGLFEDWIEESYRAVAPKKLIALLRENKEA
jgi:predicted DNA-binding protein (MmcQ/YjbR family)